MASPPFWPHHFCFCRTVKPREATVVVQYLFGTWRAHAAVRLVLLLHTSCQLAVRLFEYSHAHLLWAVFSDSTFLKDNHRLFLIYTAPPKQSLAVGA